MKINKETSFKNEPGSPERGAVMHVPLVATYEYITKRKKEDKNHFDKGGQFSHRNFISCF